MLGRGTELGQRGRSKLQQCHYYPHVRLRTECQTTEAHVAHFEDVASVMRLVSLSFLLKTRAFALAPSPELQGAKGPGTVQP